MKTLDDINLGSTEEKQNVTLEYASPTPSARHGAWGLVGFSLAIFSFLGVAWVYFLSVWMELTLAVRVKIAPGPAFLLLLLLILGLIFSAAGLRRGRKLFPLLGLFLSLLAAAGTIVLYRTTWGLP